MIKETIQAVNTGSETVDQTAASLNKTTAVTAEAVSVIDKIAIASQEQAESTAEESVAASEELTAQSVTMQELISRFQLRDSVSTNSDSAPAETETCPVPEDIPASIGGKY